MSEYDYSFGISQIQCLDDAISVIENAPSVSKDMLSEHPEAAPYLSALSGFLETYGRQNALSPNELKHFCHIIFGAIYYE